MDSQGCGLCQDVDLAAIEEDAVPVHFPGMVAHWPALRLWRGDAGLQRLVALAGAAHVEALASPQSGLAYGDMQHLLLLGCTLREFLDGTLARQLQERAPPGSSLQLYLAQSPLCAAPPGRPSTAGSSSSGCGSASVHGALAALQPAPLHALMQDLEVPQLLQAAPLSQVNFWASMSTTRSSLHYDPYQNLLCVARGCKTVWLAPPSCTPVLRPQPLTHESANHAPADLARPDLQRFPQLALALAQVKRFEVEAEDALFIPEGWWHQVDSEGGTLAVNFWWEGAVSRQLGGHMDRYYLRRLVQSLVEQQKAAALAALPRCDLHQLAAAAAGEQQARASQQQQQQQHSEAGKAGGSGQLAAQPVQHQQASVAPEAEAASSQLPAHHAAAIESLEAAAAEHLAAGPGGSPPPVVASIAAALAAESAQALLSVLLGLRRRNPGLAAHLLMAGLGPAGWELLSGCMERRQEELAEQGSVEAAEAAVGALCDELYSAVEDRSALLEVILAAKEAFSQQALQAVLGTELAGCLPGGSPWGAG